MMANTLTVGAKAEVLKGCNARVLRRREIITITKIESLGADFSHQVKVVFTTNGVRTLTFYARHINRLSDDAINLNDGNPLHKITIKRVG